MQFNAFFSSLFLYFDWLWREWSTWSEWCTWMMRGSLVQSAGSSAALQMPQQMDLAGWCARLTPAYGRPADRRLVKLAEWKLSPTSTQRDGKRSSISFHVFFFFLYFFLFCVCVCPVKTWALTVASQMVVTGSVSGENWGGCYLFCWPHLSPSSLVF